MQQSIRIIGGRFRGKKLHFPAIEDLRPTPARVRETLFNWLMHDVRDSRCLDAFAGSGALGFEAYSRGASEVLFLENNAIAATSLQKQAASFNSTALIVKKIDFFNFVKNTHQSFDIIFLDPPFAQNHLLECFSVLSSSSLLAPKGLIYIEGPAHSEVTAPGWRLLKQQVAGQVRYGLYQRTCSI